MRRGTDTQTRMTNIHFSSSTTHAKCNNVQPIVRRWINFENRSAYFGEVVAEEKRRPTVLLLTL